MLRGTFAAMAVTDLLDWAERRRVTGRLVFDGDGITRTFHLEAGAAVWASSTEPSEHLSLILRSSGVIDDVALAASMADGADQPLGTRLVEHGAVAPESLRSALVVKIRESLCDVLLWNEGMFDFEPAPAATRSGVRAVVAISDVLAAAATRGERWPAIRARIPDDETGFQWREGSDPALIPPPRPAVDDARLLAAVADGNDVRGLVAALGGERFAVLDRLAELVDAGALVLVPASAPDASPNELIDTAEAYLAAGAWDRALRAAAQAYTLGADQPHIAAAYRRIERGQVALLARELLVRVDGAVPIPILRRGAAELDGAALTDVERRLLHAVDGRWDLLTIIHHASVRTAEALMVFARLSERGIVHLAT